MQAGSERATDLLSSLSGLPQAEPSPGCRNSANHAPATTLICKGLTSVSPFAFRAGCAGRDFLDRKKSCTGETDEPIRMYIPQDRAKKSIDG